MKTGKRVLSVLLAILMIMLSVPMAFAADVTSGSAGASVNYMLESNGVMKITGTGPMTSYANAAAAPWASQAASIKSVYISSGVTTVGAYAFSGCTALIDVAIPVSITKFENNAFEGCTSLRSVAIPITTTEIGAYAFSGCTSLDAISILNMSCAIANSGTTIPASAKIYGYSGSTAETYAKNYGRVFVPLNSGSSGGRTPTATKAITDIEMKINENGNSYSMTWTSVGDNAKYAVEMLNPASNQWEEVASGLWPRMFSNLKEGSLGVKCEAGSDNSTNVTWSQVSGATKYEVRTELAHDSGSWNDPVSPSGFSAVLRLAPDYKQTVRVSAIGALKFRIFALDINDENKQLAYTETTQNTYIAYDDCEYTTPKAGTLSASSSAGEKESYTLMMIQAINNTRYESGKVTMTEETELKANATEIDAGPIANQLIDDELRNSLAESESSKTTCTFRGSSGTATRTVTKGDGTSSTNSYTLWRYYAITPTSGKTFLVNQHDLSSFNKAIKTVAAMSNPDGSTTVKVVLNQETFSATQKTTYHPGFLDSIADNTDQFSQSNSGSNATVGESTLTAKINKNYTLDSLDINSPYQMNASITQMLMTIKVKLDGSSVYRYTFSRVECNNHKPMIVKGFPATCLQEGQTDGIICETCNAILSPQATIPALGHDYINHNGKEPTCTESGWASYQTCSRCNFTSYTVLPASGHKEVVDRGVSPTCTDPGRSEGVHCSVCNTVLVPSQSIPAHGHDYAFHGIENATCTKNGSKVYICKYNSSHIITETIPAFGHIDTDHDGYCDRVSCGARIKDAVDSTTQPEKDNEHHSEAEDADDSASGKVCKYCGEVHEGFFDKIVGFFHSILALFGLRKK